MTITFSNQITKSNLISMLPVGNLVKSKDRMYVLKRRKNQSPEPPQPCALTDCMAVFSGAWAPNVVWCLREGPRRYSELLDDIPPVSGKVLSTRLRELEQRGVIIRKVCDTSPPSVEYSLSPLGRELIPALDAIVEVGHKLKEQGYAA